MKLLFLGASNTDCGHCFTPDNLGNGYVKETASRLYQHFPKQFLPGSIVNGGTDGFTFPRIYQKWTQMYRKESFELAVICGGINEVGIIMNTNPEAAAAEALLTASARSLHELLVSLLNCGTKQIILCEPFLFEKPDYLLLWKPQLTDVRSMIRETAASVSAFTPCRFTDLSRPCSRQNLSGGTDTQSLIYLPLQQILDDACQKYGSSAVTADGIHLTSAGHVFLGELLFTQICAIMGCNDTRSINSL